MIPADDPEVLASRATAPQFYRAPSPHDHGRGYQPMDYQYSGVEYMIRRENGLFGDEPGLGKSAEAIMLSNAIEAKRTLVVCPASLRLNWQREIDMWSTKPNVKSYPVMKSRDGVSLVHDYVIVSYDLLRNDGVLAALLDGRWDHLILDEAHMLKDPKGNKRTKVICAPDLLPSVVGRITLCSGTIMPNQPIECYNPIRLTNWNAIDKISLEEFKEYYYDWGSGFVTITRKINGETVTEQKWSNHVRNVPRNLGDLQHRLRKHLMVRRLKKDVLPQLPAKQWHPFPIDASDADIQKALKHPGWAEAERLYEMDPHAFEMEGVMDGTISTARRVLGEAKAPAVVEFVKELVRSGVQKVVVGAWHHSVLGYMRQELDHLGLTFMDGSTSPARKQEAVDQFQNNPKVRIILGQMLPLGEGWTLTAAQDMVLAEPFWVPGKNDQLFDRINRLGQQSNHTIGHIPIVPGTLDERILARAIEKDQHIYLAQDHIHGI